MVLTAAVAVTACGASQDEARQACLSAGGASGDSPDPDTGFTFIEPFDTAHEGHTFFMFYASPAAGSAGYRFTVGSCHYKDGAAEYEATARHDMSPGPDSMNGAINWFRQTFGPNALAVIHRMKDDPDIDAAISRVLSDAAEELRR